jgi:pyridoxamine-phosphate oxidase
MNLYDLLSTTQEPLLEIHSWIQEAKEAGVGLPHAMNIATSNQQGQPSSRMVLLKSLSDDGLVFFTDYEGQKGQHILSNNKVALNFWWAKTNKQIRVEGSCYKVPEAESDEYFQQRPRGSQISATASHQSSKISSYEDLVREAQALETEFIDKSLTRPARWGGFLIKPKLIEFWIDQKNRLHRRKLFIFKEGKWEESLLSP